MYIDNPNEIPNLLEIKAKETTVIEVNGLLAIKEWLDPDRKHRWPQNLNGNKIIQTIDEALDAATKLQELRCSNSHHKLVAQASEKYVRAILKVSEAFRT